MDSLALSSFVVSFSCERDLELSRTLFQPFWRFVFRESLSLFLSSGRGVCIFFLVCLERGKELLTVKFIHSKSRYDGSQEWSSCWWRWLLSTRKVRKSKIHCESRVTLAGKPDVQLFVKSTVVTALLFMLFLWEKKGLLKVPHSWLTPSSFPSRESVSLDLLWFQV
jgi:hypothetical protein